MGEIIQGKHFSITDPKDVNTVVYRLDETEKEIKDICTSYTGMR